MIEEVWEPVIVRYRNHRGETSWRRIRPISVVYGTTEWRREPQWLLAVVDLDKRKERTFALAGVLQWGPEGGEVFSAGLVDSMTYEQKAFVRRVVSDVAEGQRLRITEAIRGRIDASERTADTHPDAGERVFAIVRRDAYRCALWDVEAAAKAVVKGEG